MQSVLRTSRTQASYPSGPVRAQRSLRVRASGDAPEVAPVTDSALPIKMNTTPHPREMRQYFYKLACDGMSGAIKSGIRRMQLQITIPELNPETDVYRVGTLLEMVREMATQLAADGKKVKVCVQGSLGQGVFQGLPLALSGVRRILEQMDWGDVSEFVTFGEINGATVDDADYYILLSPQNVVGTSLIPLLEEMVAAAEGKGKTVILLNPNLKDKQASGGVMGVRGRKERMEFADSFDIAVHFRLLYVSGTWFPIMGACKYVAGGLWEIYDREDLGKGKERYVLKGTFPERPDSGEGRKLLDAVYVGGPGESPFPAGQTGAPSSSGGSSGLAVAVKSTMGIAMVVGMLLLVIMCIVACINCCCCRRRRKG